MQDSVFFKFVTKSETGVGQGLYISKGILEALSRRIWAENNTHREGIPLTLGRPKAKDPVYNNRS